MPPALIAVLLLCASNLFMTYAWYGHLRDFADKPLFLVALLAWGVAFFEYQLQVPANRIGATTLNVPQLRILQEVVSLAVFVPFAVFYMKAELTLDFLWAGLCLLGAVYFMFRGGMPVHG